MEFIENTSDRLKGNGKREGRLVHVRAAWLFAFLFLSSLFSSAACAEEGFMPVVGKMKTHTVQSGEDLYTIGLKYHVAIDHLMWANDVNTLQVSVGRQLTIPSQRIVPAQISSGLVLNLPERMLYLFEDDRVVSWYPVAIGAPDKWMTPVVETRIVNMAKNPTWLPPEWANQEKPVEPGPDNPLGDRWIGLAQPGYGIHATNSLLSIGMAVSHGCIRMNPRDAEELYDKVKVGMPVKIVYEPILIGQSEESGLIYLSAYPDVYGKIPDMKEALAQKLRKYDLEGLVSAEQSQAILGRKRGIPEAVVGLDIAIKVNDTPVELPLPPVRRGGKIMVLSELLKFIGAGISKNEETGLLEISRKNNRFTLTEGAAENQVLVWKGRTLLPLRDVIEGLGLSLKWNSGDRSISILGASLEQVNSSPPRENNKENTYEDKIRSAPERF